jgi:hypothetical protein
MAAWGPLLLAPASHQAMRDLAAVAQVQDVELAASAAMIMGHEAAKVQDQEAIMMLQTKIDVSPPRLL